MKLSARNQLKGKVVSIEKGAVNSEVALEVAQDIIITSVITNRAVENLGLKVGDQAYAVVKASNVMVAVD